MKKVFTKKIIGLLILQSAWRLTAWTVVPAFLLFAKKVTAPGYQKYTLPKCLQWAQTPDYLLPGDLLGEPSVKWVYDHLGWFITSWYWIGYRNVGHGILWNSGHPTPDFPQHMSEEQLEKYGTQIRQTKIGFLWVMWGFKTVNDELNTQNLQSGWYWAVPWYSVRLSKRDLGGSNG
jgi:hypothetical protein